jgi:hypothetical protein
VSGTVWLVKVWSGKVLWFAMGLLSACHRMAAPLLPACDLFSLMADIFADAMFHCSVRVSFSNHWLSELTANICRTSFSILFHSRALLHMAKP